MTTSSRGRPVSVQMYKLLRLLLERGQDGGYPLDLSREIKLSSTTTGKMLQNLDRQGLVDRWRTAPDGAPARFYARLNENGRRRAEQIVDEITKGRP